MSESQPRDAASGWLVGKTHVFPVRVYYADTDAGGIVYHATYLSFAERARTEMMRLIGVDHARLQREARCLFAVRACTIDYRHPAVLDDLLEVRSRLLTLGGASMHIEQTILRDDDPLVVLTVRLACMQLAGKAARIPSAVRDILHTYLSQEAN